uniref:FH2 domain containing 1 n=1 Tax=Scleropages formosus TaxID=113540 RepID=A0A8C9RBQ5_SCLFO
MHVMNSSTPVNQKESDVGDENVVAGFMPASSNVGTPPVPPPPPPPAVPPPPPPPPPGTGIPSHGLRKKRRVRSFFWKPIPEEKVRGRANIWTLSVRQQQHYQIDVRTIEELFGQREEARDTASQGGRSRASFRETKEEITILDSKRGMNVGIFLKQFKKSNQAITEDVRCGNSELYGPEPLKELLKLLPESDEVRKLRAFKGDAGKLALADSFMYLLIQVPSFDVRIEAMVLKEEFSPLCSGLSHDVGIVRTATKELMSCEELHAVLHLVLQAGNIMNAGGYAGNAVGFKLSSLLSMADTRANRPGMNLLHFVALEAQKKDASLLKFPERLQHVRSAVRISVENIEAELNSLRSRMTSVEEKVQKDAELLQQLDRFLERSKEALRDVNRRWLELRKEGNVLIDFFCEDKDTFRLDECFRIFQDFCLKFEHAVKDNVERKQKDAVRRLRELEEKRRSWGGAEPDAQSFGRSSSETDVETLSREGRTDLLREREGSRGPLSAKRSSSARRSRRSTDPVSTAADRDLHSYLERTGFGSLPRPGRSPRRTSPAWLGGPSPLPRTDRDDDDDNNNGGSGPPPGSLDSNREDHNENINPKIEVGNLGQMKISVERHALVPGLQGFDFVMHGNTRPISRGHLVLNGPETDGGSPAGLVLETPPSSKSWEGKEGPRSDWDRSIAARDEEDESSTLSSTTCDTPLPTDDTTTPPKDPIRSVNDTDDLKPEGENSRPAGDPDKDQQAQQSAVSPSAMSVCSNAPSASPSSRKHQGDKPANNLSGLRPAGESPGPSGKRANGKAGLISDSKSPSSKPKSTSRGTTPPSTGSNRPVRTLHPSENRSLRTAVTVSNLSRSASSASRSEEGNSSRRSPQDRSAAGRRSETGARTSWRSGHPAEDPKPVSRWARDQVPRTPSLRKQPAKATKVVPRPPPEEKMCRSTMRALAQAQAAAGGAAAQAAPSKAALPGFARSTVASSSRLIKDSAPASAPATPSKSGPLARSTSQRQAGKSGAHGAPDDRAQGPLRRVQSMRATRRSPRSSEMPPNPSPHNGSGSFSDKSVPSKESSASRAARPSWK